MIRLNAAAVIGRWGKAALPAVPQLIRLLKDETADGNAALSLGMIGPDPKEAIPALIEAVEEQRPFAATALAKLGVSARVAGPTLQTVSKTGSECVRREALLALHQLGQ